MLKIFPTLKIHIPDNNYIDLIGVVELKCSQLNGPRCIADIFTSSEFSSKLWKPAENARVINVCSLSVCVVLKQMKWKSLLELYITTCNEDNKKKLHEKKRLNGIKPSN